MPTKTTTKKTAAAAPRKPAARKTTAPKAAAPKAKKAAPFTQADIALRAYFIAEKRQKLGLPGDANSDWIEAERQLADEARPKVKTKKS